MGLRNVSRHSVKQLKAIFNKLKGTGRKSTPLTEDEVEIVLRDYFADGADGIKPYLLRLDRERMEVIKLVFFEHKTQEEAAKIIGCSQSLVSMNFDKAFKMMRGEDGKSS